VKILVSKNWEPNGELKFSILVHLVLIVD